MKRQPEHFRSPLTPTLSPRKAGGRGRRKQSASPGDVLAARDGAPRSRTALPPDATASGSGASGDSWERSSSQAKNRSSGRRSLRDVIADRAAKHRIAGFERVEDRAAA